MILKNCILTKEDALVKKQYIVDDEVAYHTGIDIYCNNVYSPCRGVIVRICRYYDNWDIILQYNESIFLRIINLNHLDIHIGEIIEDYQLLGTADKYIHFEYLSTKVSSPKFKVRIPTMTLYKQDPMEILNGSIEFYHGNPDFGERESDFDDSGLLSSW